MAGLASLEAQAGDLVLPKWRLLLKWAKSRRFRPGPGILYRETPDGVLVWARRRGSYPHPFRVALEVEGFRVAPGFLDGKIPAVDGITLDGFDKDGLPTARPLLPFGNPPKGLESWVILRRPKTKEGKPWLEVAPDPKGSGPEDGHPLAWVKWSGGKPESVHQIARLNCESGISAQDENGKAAVLFWGV